MRILGIDPGLQTTGFGVVDVDGHRLSYVASGTIRTTALDRGDLPGRLKLLFDGITEVAKRYQPDSSAVEIVFVNTNPQSTLLLGQARGGLAEIMAGGGLGAKDARPRRGRRAGHCHHACACGGGDGAAGGGGAAAAEAACDVQGGAGVLNRAGHKWARGVFLGLAVHPSTGSGRTG
jgi:hypothetical protein